jgi:transcriptional regulator with XRE-family HTH domain
VSRVPPSGRDFATIGQRVRERRQKFGLSTEELAERAGVARYTIVRVEQGKPCTPATLNKIRRALHLFTDQMTRRYAEGPFAVHRAEETQWSVSIAKAEYQRRVTDDDPIHVNDPEERRRLGEIGFQPFFTAILNSELAGGVGNHGMMEIHRPSWVDRHFGEEFVYCLRGAVTITVDDVPCTLREGDAMSFDATRPHQYAPAEEVGPDTPVPLILLVVSLRPGERYPRPE